MPRSLRIRLATENDISAIGKSIVEWLNWKTSRKESIKRAIKKKELLVAEQQGKVMGFVHQVMHEDVIDGGLNAFITAVYVFSEHRNKGIGSKLLQRAVKDALDKGAVGIEVSTASPEARRFYERHDFKQFMGKWSMGEVFLELDIRKYKQNLQMNLKKSESR